jgi:hypothetical protein
MHLFGCSFAPPLFSEKDGGTFLPELALVPVLSSVPVPEFTNLSVLSFAEVLSEPLL